jgi:formylglycine-generating enzyme required for sulfatase activity
MVEIPGGEFWMGASEEEEGSNWWERPQHQVKVSPFFMGKYPVTQAQWRAVASLPKVKRELDVDPSYFKGDNRPVESASWDDAIEFCKRLARKTGNDYRLPSEAEWEYACRAGTTTPYHFGQTISQSLANFMQEKGRGRTTTVGRFQVANAFGLYDMHGQVFEWCEDDWNDDYEGAPTDGSAWIRRGGLGGWIKGTGNKVVVRGGSWDDFPSYCRSAYRYFYSPDDRGYYIGLRVVCVAPRTT